MNGTNKLQSNLFETPSQVIILGAGYRGRAYAAYADAHPDRLRVVGVADPVQAETIRAPQYWTDWRDCLKARPEADWVVIALPDALHREAALAALEAGYHLLLEKPIAVTEAGCREVIAKALAVKRLVLVGHVLRYTPTFAHIKAILDSGELGTPVSITHQESVGYRKMAHSYCRGEWADAQAACPVILAKCSHDFDLFAWWLGRRCTKVSSFGSLMHFRRKNQPVGAGNRCVACPKEIARHCIWNAVALYMEQDDLRYLFADPSLEHMEQLVRDSRYGRCVFACDNDVPDHQSVMMEFDGGATVTHTMAGFTAETQRVTRISCTGGELIYDGTTLTASRFDHHGLCTGIPAFCKIPNRSRHEGGDFNIVTEMLRLIQTADDATRARVTAEALQSHLIAFAAERSRRQGGEVIRIDAHLQMNGSSDCTVEP